MLLQDASLIMSIRLYQLIYEARHHVTPCETNSYLMGVISISGSSNTHCRYMVTRTRNNSRLRFSLDYLMSKNTARIIWSHLSQWLYYYIIHRLWSGLRSRLLVTTLWLVGITGLYVTGPFRSTSKKRGLWKLILSNRDQTSLVRILNINDSQLLFIRLL